ncbi:heterokaryon incompatibility protein-domain-containing protein [Stachybotrys elegans]|uniref:Heterokaryon incompatibility protein-domain-containing protein n=1 Tax=Stachybotrys elegans TaxID=80388 RepID=A0A8K0WMP7_9HYPO|nr:heterokaryon incompatibility protein-domain-containing protein [Stachybotrys elegans]
MGPPAIPYRPTPPGKPCQACGHPREALQPSISISWLEHLEANASNGCHLCELIVQGIYKYLGRSNIPEDTTLKIESNTFGAASLDVTIFHAPAKLSFVLSPVESTASKDLCFKSWATGFGVPPSTGSHESFSWVQQCLSQCDASHKLCNQAGPEPSLPSRVLDVGFLPSDPTKLLVTGKAITGRYICLSHRWGTTGDAHPAWHTLADRLESHQRGLDWEALPLVFQDAIGFTRKLGIRYLWIDSLCIVQDDRDDWAREGSEMASIYSNAYLTLAAARSEGSASSMFASLDPKFTLRPLSLPESVKAAQGFDSVDDHGVFVRHSLTHMARPTIGRDTGIQPFPLLRRGWVFQERFLSPRTVYFGPQEISWECVELSACQCSGSSMMSLSASSPLWAQDYAQQIPTPKLFHRPSTLQQIARDRGKEEVARRWMILVQEYTQLDLTFDSDIFPALSGLVQAYSSVFQGRYCAGLWEEFLIEGLLWYFHGTVEQWARPPRQWRAPSWSWASVLGPVEFLAKTSLSEKCEIVGISCQHSGPDPAGELASGHIVLRGRIFPSKVEYTNITEPQNPSKLFELLTFSSLGERKYVTSYADQDFSLPGPGHIPDGTELMICLVGKTENPECFYFMMLKPLEHKPGTTVSVYRRVGIVKMLGQFGPTTNTTSFFANWVHQQSHVSTIMIR